MPELILVPLDGSSLAARALPYAVALARERHLPLLLLRVLEPSPARGLPLVQEPDARSYLEHVASQLRDEGIDTETHLSSTLFGTVPEVLVGKAQQRGCELIVMSTHGRSGLGRWVYGTVAEDVLRRSSVPVLLISSTCDRVSASGKRLRVLLPLDGSGLSEEVIQPMLTGLDQLASEIVLLQVQPSIALPAVYLSDGSDSFRSGIEECQDQVARQRKQDPKGDGTHAAGRTGHRDFQGRRRTGRGPDRDGDTRTYGDTTFGTRQRLNRDTAPLARACTALPPSRYAV